MSLRRDSALVIEAISSGHTVSNCGDGADSTSGDAFNSKVVDRLALGQHYDVCQPYLTAVGGETTSTSLRKITIESQLQHGDSSGGGDMADYSTAEQPGSWAFGSTGGTTTDEVVWTSGVQRIYSRPHEYDIRGAKQYLRVQGIITGHAGTTSTTFAGAWNVTAGLAFRGGRFLPHSTTPYNLRTALPTTATNT